MGSSVAISILQRGAANELLLYDVKPGLADGEAMDLAHGSSFYPQTIIRSASLEEMRDADVLVVAAGRGGRPGESRLNLLQENARIVASIGNVLSGTRAVVVMVTNPVDVMTHVMKQAADLPADRAIGTGTTLDTARLRQHLGAKLDVAPKSIHAHVLGEHGDSEFVLWSQARVGTTPLRDWPGWEPTSQDSVEQSVRGAAQAIIQRKGATNHAIGLVTATLVHWMARDERRVVTVSRVHAEVEGVPNVALSLPTVLTRCGTGRVMQPKMVASERALLQRSAEVLREATESALQTLA